MKRELNVFLCAVMFFTRIPVRLSVEYNEALLSKSTKYLPLLGLFIGGVGALVYWGASYLLPVSISVLLSMVATIILTGAFHEDGFADVCDGFGGGWTKERILEIMKDSRIGAYGMIGMSLLLLSKFSSLTEVETSLVPFVIIVGHTVSRWSATLFVFTHEYSRTDELSKSKPLVKKLDWGSFMVATVFTGLSFLLLPPIYIIGAGTVLFTKMLFARYINKWIDGYTGDVLGATQQLTEVVFYITVLAISNFV